MCNYRIKVFLPCCLRNTNTGRVRDGRYRERTRLKLDIGKGQYFTLVFVLSKVTQEHRKIT